MRSSSLARRRLRFSLDPASGADYTLQSQAGTPWLVRGAERLLPLVVVIGPYVLVDELSADPFKLFSARVPELHLSTVHGAADLRRQAESGFDVAGKRAELG